MLLDEGGDGGLVQVGEDLDVLLCLGVAYVEPELVEGVGRGAVAVEPYVAALGLAKFLAVGLGDERTGDAEGLGLVAQRAADELGTGGHVAPLVVAAELQAHAILLILVEEVVALKELIGKLGEAQADRKSVV